MTRGSEGAGAASSGDPGWRGRRGGGPQGAGRIPGREAPGRRGDASTAALEPGVQEPGLKPGTVYVLRDAKPVRLELMAGITDGAFTEVRAQGLQPGDVVIVGLETPQANANTNLQPPPGMGGPRFGPGGRGGGGGGGRGGAGGGGATRR